jgi:hypothetical protein
MAKATEKKCLSLGRCGKTCHASPATTSDECEKLNGDENCYFPPDIHWRKPRYYLAPSNAGLHGDQYMQIHLQQSRCDGLSGNQLFATGAMLVKAGFMMLMLMSRPHEPARRPFDYAASPPVRTAGRRPKRGCRRWRALPAAAARRIPPTPSTQCRHITTDVADDTAARITGERRAQLSMSASTESALRLAASRWTQTFVLQPGYGAFTDRDGKRAFNIRAASPSFALLLPILPISRVA